MENVKEYIPRKRLDSVMISYAHISIQKKKNQK